MSADRSVLPGGPKSPAAVKENVWLEVGSGPGLPEVPARDGPNNGRNATARARTLPTKAHATCRFPLPIGSRRDRPSLHMKLRLQLGIQDRENTSFFLDAARTTKNDSHGRT